jgi:hypothetical protein
MWISMRRLLALALAGGAAWWFFVRRRDSGRPSVTIGYTDGSAVTLDPGSPELDRLLRIAAEAATR